MKYIFILNPKAGAGGTEEKLRNEIAALPCSDQCEIYLTKAPLDATEYVKRTLAENHGEKFRFIACGGDGTINEVFSGRFILYRNVVIISSDCDNLPADTGNSNAALFRSVVSSSGTDDKPQIPGMFHAI